MNEKIKELAEQAEIWDMLERSQGISHPVIACGDELQKFAELLLEECCQICIDKWVEKNSEDSRDCYLAIQDHFKIGPNYEQTN